MCSVIKTSNKQEGCSCWKNMTVESLFRSSVPSKQRQMENRRQATSNIVTETSLASCHRHISSRLLNIQQITTLPLFFPNSLNSPIVMRTVLSIAAALLLSTGAEGYVVHRPCKPTSPVHYHQYQNQHRRIISSSLWLIDPSVLDAATTVASSTDLIQQTTEVATNTFFNTFVSRIVGALVGNLFAGLIFKYIADQFFQKTNEVKEKVTAQIVRPDISSSAWFKLLFCIMIDLIGDSSFILPGVGELEDVGWAPISAFILSQFFGSSTVTGLEFAKEILPGTDILPLATVAWLLENVFVDSPLTGILGLKSKSVPKENEDPKSP
jgi:hypothetical protein